MSMKNLHLILSISILIPVALAYGIAPKTILILFFDIHLDTIDVMNICRAIMGLYLGMVGIWLLGIYDKAYWKMATVTNGVFMGGLALGRILSLILDGVPSLILLLGIVGESVLALFAFYQLKKY
jgi:Domain of unknown function (DUF4345)